MHGKLGSQLFSLRFNYIWSRSHIRSWLITFLLLIRYVTRCRLPSTLWPSTFVVCRLWRNQTLSVPVSLAKFNNPQLSYSRIKIENLGSTPLVFDRKWILRIPQWRKCCNLQAIISYTQNVCALLLFVRWRLFVSVFSFFSVFFSVNCVASGCNPELRCMANIGPPKSIASFHVL